MNKYEQACFDKRIYDALIKKPDIEIIKKCKCGNPVKFVYRNADTYELYRYSAYHDHYVCYDCLLDSYVPIGNNFVFITDNILQFIDKKDTLLCSYHFYCNDEYGTSASVHGMKTMKKIACFLLGI